MKIYLIILVSSLLFFDLAAEDKQKIIFFRPAKAGSMMKCRLSAAKVTSSKTSFADVSKPDKVNSLTQNITAAGTLKILEVMPNGHASKIEFTFESINGKQNQDPFDQQLEGRTIEVDMSVKPICGFRIKGSDEKMSKSDIQMLSLLFHPAPEENTGDYIGTDNPIGLGDSWKARTSPFVRFFKNQGVIFPEDKIIGTVSLKSRKNFESIDCWEIEEKLNVKGLPGLDFFFSLSIFLPVDSKLGNVKMTRKAFLKLEKVPQGKHFMTSGIKRLTLEMTDTMTAIMIPEEKKF